MVWEGRILPGVWRRCGGPPWEAKSIRIFAMRLMLFCAGHVVDDVVTVNRVFLVNPVCSLQSANVIHRHGAAMLLHQHENPSVKIWNLL